MSLSSEWTDRLKHWVNKLEMQFYTPLGPIEFTGFTTLDQLSAPQASQMNFVPMPEGTKWGAKWEYGWFKGTVKLPEQAKGKRIVLDIKTGGESIVYVDGSIKGHRRDDWIIERHHFVSDLALSKSAVPGESYEILVESYAGHGKRECLIGPVLPGTESPYEPGAAQASIETSTFGIWNEEAYQLWVDVKILLDIRNNINPNSLRVSEIDRGLKDFTLIVDFEQSYEAMMESFSECRNRLKPLLECRNGSTAPLMNVFGHSHIDVAWLWPLAETERKCARTFSTQLAHMEDYPEYVFLQSQPHLYMMTKTLYPELYKKITEKVKEGRFIPEGGMWVEADTNMTGGESLIRQFIHGKRFFKEEFGLDNELLWLPDVFGYSAALPQIMKGCGVNYFSTQKIFWDYNQGERFPYNYFVWQGIDGSEIISFIHDDYNSRTTPEAMIKRWDNRVQKEGISQFLVPFGYGDGGGGPARDHIENTRRMADLEGTPKVKMCNPVDFFKGLEESGQLPENRYVGELYFQAHRGVYTSQAKTKKGNRKSELGLREAEMWGTAAAVLAGYAYPLALMDAQWKKVLLNQFHDILPGSSIARVYEEAEATFAEVIGKAGEIAGEAAARLCSTEGGMTVFNSLSWDRKALVQLPEGWKGARYGNGGALPVQLIDGKLTAEVDTPSCGWTSIADASVELASNSAVKAEANLLENEHLRVSFNSKGEITGLYDKDKGCELAAGACNNFKLYKDVPRTFDAWDIDSMYEMSPVELPEDAQISVKAAGPLCSQLEIRRKINNSMLIQTVSIKKGSRRLDFKTEIDWQESHKLLKVCFPVAIHSEEALHEVQFGYVKRPNHRSRKYDADRFEVCNQKWTALAEENRGVAVLNDCKYGVNVLGGSINLTLLRAAKAPDFNADIGKQEFTYSIYCWNGSLMDSGVVREAYELNCPVITAEGSCDNRSLFGVDEANIVIDTVKPAEDGTGDVIVRLYESMRSAVKCTLTTSLPVDKAVQTNMLEVPEKALQVKGGSIDLEFRPFEVKTLRLG